MFASAIRAAAAAVLIAAPALAEDTLRIATQMTGTVNWELTTITANGLDKANGFTLQVQDVAAGPRGAGGAAGGRGRRDRVGLAVGRAPAGRGQGFRLHPL